MSIHHHIRSSVFISLVASSLYAAPLYAQSNAPITEVVLYPGGATIVRSVNLSAGNGTVVVTRLPASFDAKTLRVEAGPGTRVGETVIRDVAKAEAFSPQEAELEAKILALTNQQAALDAEIAATQLVKAYLERIGAPGSAPGGSAGPDAKTISAQAEAIGRAASEALGKGQRLEQQKQELAAKEQVLQANLTKLKTGDRNARELTIQVSASKPSSLKLSYQVSNAGWKPTYRAELVSAEGRVLLERIAIVSQKTGEDWTQARIVLSTTQPRNAPSGPEPKPWLLRYTPPQPAREVRLPSAPATSYAPAASAPAPAMAANSGASDYAPPTFEIQSTFSTEFEVPQRMSIASDGREVSVPLGSYVLPVQQVVVTSPRLSPHAFVVAQGERPSGVWPVGPVQLFRDGNFIGSNTWNLADNTRFRLSFGRDDLVRVTSNPVKEDSSSNGVFTKRAERHIAYVYTVNNAHTQAIDLEVLDAKPVETSEEIKVTAKIEPKPVSEEWNNQRGVISWKKTIPANDMAKFAVDYLIEYPREGQLYGLP